MILSGLDFNVLAIMNSLHPENLQQQAKRPHHFQIRGPSLERVIDSSGHFEDHEKDLIGLKRDLCSF